jgi:hypothetical protein
VRYARVWLLVAGSAVVALCAGLGLWVAGRRPHEPQRPHVNAAQALAMLPAIEAYLDSPAGRNQGGMLAQLYPKLHSRVFCTATIIEIRPASRGWRVGMETDCTEYARRGDTLLEGTGAGEDEVMVLAGSGTNYRVVSDVNDAYPITPDDRWVDRHFSRAAAHEINYGTWPDPPDPAVQARLAFGLPPGAKAVEP